MCYIVYHNLFLTTLTRISEVLLSVPARVNESQESKWKWKGLENIGISWNPRSPIEQLRFLREDLRLAVLRLVSMASWFQFPLWIWHDMWCLLPTMTRVWAVTAKCFSTYYLLLSRFVLRYTFYHHFMQCYEHRRLGTVCYRNGIDIRSSNQLG